MFDWLLPEKHAISILKKDHETLNGLFDAFEKAETVAAKEQIIGQAVTALRLHTVLEEEIFYPAVRQHIGKKIMNEADQEHDVAKVLLAELDSKGREDDHRDARFTVLAEKVRHHVREEENEMLPKARDMDLDFEALGRAMLERREQLLAEGFPLNGAQAMVKCLGSQLSDSRSPAARRSRLNFRQRQLAGRSLA